MSGLVLVYNRDGTAVQVGVLESMMAALAHRAPDGQDTWLCGDIALGHQHHWTTPEEVGERQPLADVTGRYRLLFDGRLDNREELLATLQVDQRRGGQLSDAALFLRAYAQWEEDCLEHLLGEFALALHDELGKRVLLARDPLGDRTLFYHLTPGLLVAASEEHALLVHPAVSGQLDESTLAHYYAIRVPEDGSTFFFDVKELLPGQALSIGREAVQQRRYWQAAPGELRYRDDAQYAEHLRELLRQAVVARLRSVTPVGVMMSGGLDSTSVAALAAQELARDGGGPLRTFSYVFDELTSCDERRYIEAFTAYCGTEATYVPGDDGWPLRDPDTWPVIPDVPWQGLYWRLMERIYGAACARGVGVLLGGWFGDHLYTGAEEWLADLVWEGRLLDAGRDLLQAARRFGWLAVLLGGSMQNVVKRAWFAIPGGSRLWPRRPPGPPPWLTDHAVRLIDTGQAIPSAGAKWSRLSRRQSVLGMRASRSASSRYLVERAGIEMRYPYRDRRVVEFMLAIPAHQFYRHLRFKHVLRNAMRGLSPEAIVEREEPTSLLPLAARGLAEREWATVQRVLLSRQATWPRFVRTDWLMGDLPARLRPQRDGSEAVVPWLCICAELWAGAQQQLSSP